MGMQKYFDEMFSRQSMELSVAFIARVSRVDGDLSHAAVQPMGLIRQQGAQAQEQAELGDVPVLDNARHRLKKEKFRYVSGGSVNGLTYGETDILVPEELKPGDLVLCVCCDRDITQSLKGVNALPDAGAHSKNNAVIVGVI